MKIGKLNKVTFLKLVEDGLGNQMFRIATTIGVAKKYGADYFFPRWPYNKYFETPVPTNLFIKFRRWIKYKEPNFHYDEIPLISGALSLEGYFQSDKYFKYCENEVREHFTLKNNWVEYIRKKYPQLNGDTCSIHVRRGDFIKYPNKHPTQPVSYYKMAVKKLYGSDIDKINFMICSDDIEWCKVNFNFPSMTFVEGEENVVDMFIMSMYRDNIIANSSFSWWSAWLNKNKNRVVAPKMWFGPKELLNTKDLYINSWIKL